MKKLMFGDKTYSRWLILMIDQIIISWTLFMSFLLINKFEYQELFYSNTFIYIALYSFISICVFMRMRIHTGIIRYSNTEDIIRIFMAVLLTNFVFTIICNICLAFGFAMPSKSVTEVLIMNFFVSSSLLIILRVVVKSLFAYIKALEPTEKKENILIYGSGSDSILVKKALEGSQGNTLNVIAFVDDKQDKLNKQIEQKKVYHSRSIETLRNKFNISKVLFVSDDLNINGKKSTLDKCIELGIKVVTVPQSNKWLYGKLTLNQIKDLKIEDLLDREPIVLITNNILREVFGKRILITGAAGSIGSEIVRQLVNFNPEFVVLCDQAETPLHDLQLEIEDDFPHAKTHIVMANIQNRCRMKAIFDEYRPQIIFHAAAYKHVPMMENNPSEAILTNVLGTKNLSDLAIEAGVEKFIMISTDKAVRPTNIMGASKRLAEMYIQSLNNDKALSISNDEVGANITENRTKFITTRFGNVLGSNGSVIPRFKAQIERGGPVTVTHPEITRYFMTIPEAVQLVLEAAAMGNGGEIYIFDMGDPVKIVDLATNMIKLAGLSPDKDIKIVFTGLRPGEKLYEELLLVEEQIIPTYHPKIKISKTISLSIRYVQEVIEELLSLNNLNNDYAMVKKMKEIIPDYKSKNSRYEEIDYYIIN
ncbi:NDP-sugar epimerase, includes UDP-GlcNAc-inverting 4,6-dehydratase FlaA1 and capsular polysaccharide biosynthesis protein EpsC [Pedobacter sp. ok626]|uniref:polysaccharide biosynthesis protein n=1 Tax=Pedobacter sp. ok626 TaxID=1761882 RepID=UPI00088492E1|nr:nucleoside-diphosphate sugar epimerase/dehydratase [Pedobacter sp. ok626]SDJ60142.1 NDP-sugar epimerase, includes UDP-GlcNAc-inverting 4,6-dehydratase FlaA1 and capsular polysaccharide biosynthesis protein EpsC [Pedobacter sp. ok626]